MLDLSAVRGRLPRRAAVRMEPVSKGRFYYARIRGSTSNPKLQMPRTPNAQFPTPNAKHNAQVPNQLSTMPKSGVSWGLAFGIWQLGVLGTWSLAIGFRRGRALDCAASPCSSITSGGGSSATRYSNCAGTPPATAPRSRRAAPARADPRSRRGAAGSCSGARWRSGSSVMSTMRTRVRPVAGSIISANGIGTKCPPCIETIAALPPASRYLAAQ